MSLCHAVLCNSPRFSVHLIHLVVISCNSPVRADHAVISVLATKQIPYNVSAVGICYILTRWILTKGNRIIRHHCRTHSCLSVKIESTFKKRFKVFFKVISRIHSILSETIMRISSPLTGTSARPMLCHTIDTLHAPSGLRPFSCLKGIRISLHDVTTKLRIL